MQGQVSCLRAMPVGYSVRSHAQALSSALIYSSLQAPLASGWCNHSVCSVLGRWDVENMDIVTGARSF